MSGITLISGKAVPLDRHNVDTDQIIPAKHLKRVERTGYGTALFEAWRQDPGFVLNDPAFENATVLIAGNSFGSGSSREHAVWALADYGFQAVIAASFADIFKTNCAQSGFLAVEIGSENVAELLNICSERPETTVTVDLPNQTVTTSNGWRAGFEIDASAKQMLMAGLDHIGVTLRQADEISRFEKHRPDWLPSTT